MSFRKVFFCGQELQPVNFGFENFGVLPVQSNPTEVISVPGVAIKNGSELPIATTVATGDALRRAFLVALSPLPSDPEFSQKLDQHSLEAIVEYKISRFLDQIGTFYPENLHDMIVQKIEKPLLHQVLRRVGGNQVHASKILGINRNTLRKKMKIYGL